MDNPLDGWNDKNLEIAMLTVSRLFAKYLLTDKVIVEWSEEEQAFLFTPAEEEHNEELWDDQTKPTE
tara:strand:- start:69 stop:269 length:201 start_codon:yes stop_codon:yes gene_type:complete